MQSLLMLIGFCTVLIILGALAWSVISLVIDEIKDLRRKYIQKHRFDKSPTAKCYCKDCEHWSPKSGDCLKFSGYKTTDSWFCWQAEPTTELRK